MAGQHGRSLAVSLIRAHFGDLIAKVCGCLLDRGTLSLQEIVRFTALTLFQVKNCVLIQHNCVQAFSITKIVGLRGAIKTVTLYMAIFDNILHRLRFSKFVAIVKADLGPQCGTLLEGLLQHGRLTFEQLVLRATSGQSNAVRDVLRVNFNRLVNAHYVEHCPRPEPFIAPKPDNQIAPARKRGSKSSEERLSIEQEAMIAAALSDAERFSEILDVGTDTILDAKMTEYTGFSVGDKRKCEASDADKAVQSAITEEEVLWRANFDKFVHCLKKKACVANIRTKLGVGASIVLDAMIESSGEQKAKVTSSMDSILERVRGKPEGVTMTLEDVRIILEDLGCCLCTEEMAVYTIDLRRIIESSQNDEGEMLVLNRYGQVGHRIFNLLAKKGHSVDTDSISDKTLVEKKETQGILFKLWKDDYLEMEKVILHASGQTQIFLWKVNRKGLWEHVLNDICHGALNISERIADMVKQHPEMFGKQASGDPQRNEKIARLRRSWMILQSSLSKLDDAMMLFHDFLK